MTDIADFIRSLYAAFGRGDVKTILDNLDPGVAWCSHGDRAIIPWAGPRQGLADVASFFQVLDENLDYEAFEPGAFHASGDTLTVLGHTRARSRKGGHGVLDYQWAHVFTVSDGKLAGFQEFCDTAAVEHALAV